MRRHASYVISAFVVVSIIPLLLVSCGGGGGGGGAAAGLQLKVVFKDVTSGVTGTVLKPRSKALSAVTGTTGEAGSSVDSMLGQVQSFELQKSSDSSWITVYNSSGYVEFVGTSGQSATDTIVATLPAAGTYKAYRLTTTGVKMKLKLVQGGTTYYTTLQTVSSGQAWTFSTNAADYNYLTYPFTPSSVFQSDFPTPLTVTNTGITLYYVSQRAGTVSCDGTTANVDITYCSEDHIADGILPTAPVTMAQFVVTATTSSTTPPTRSNTITAFFGAQDNFLGATVFRPDNWYFNGSTMATGSGLYSSTTKTGSIDVTIMDGDGIQDGIYNVTANFDCTSRTFSSLVITPTGTGTSIYSTDYTMATSGTATCTAL